MANEADLSAMELMPAFNAAAKIASMLVEVIQSEHSKGHGQVVTLLLPLHLLVHEIRGQIDNSMMADLARRLEERSDT